MVYVARCGDAVKIGFSEAPRARIAALQNGTPDPLELVGIMPGSRDFEAALHRAFREERIKGEWFRITGPVAALVSALEADLDVHSLLSRLLLTSAPRITVKRSRSTAKSSEPARRNQLSDEGRERLRQNARRLHAEGRLGGAQYGKLGGRPRNLDRFETLTET